MDPLKFVPLVAGMFDLWTRSLRYEVHGPLATALEQAEAGRPTLLALWHGELFPLTGYQHHLAIPLAAVISQSKDGEFISRIMERLGHITVRGSSTRGGVRALLQVKRVMEHNRCLGVFTVDGPRGPRHRVKEGVIYMAQKLNACILPVRAHASAAKHFDKSWDHFMVPYPFSRCAIYAGETLTVTSEKLEKDVLERERLRLEERLLALKP